MGLCTGKLKPPLKLVTKMSPIMTQCSTLQSLITGRQRFKEAVALYVELAGYMELLGDIQNLPHSTKICLIQLIETTGAMMVLTKQMQKQDQLKNQEKLSVGWYHNLEDQLNKAHTIINDLYLDEDFSCSFPILRENFKFLADSIDDYLSLQPIYLNPTVCQD